MSLYQQDYYGWTHAQADLLRAGNMTQLDITNLIEEIEDMGRSVRNQLESRLTVLLTHLLKWDFQTEYRNRSWELTIKGQRVNINRLLKKNPSLKSVLAECIEDAYEDAVIEAAKETNLSEAIFPETCQYTMDKILGKEDV